jgi:hypothetical protein
MKRLVGRGLKAVWRATEALRRPILRKLEAFITRCVRAAAPPPPPADVTPSQEPSETDVLMDHIVRSLVRMQSQIDALEQAVLERLAPPNEADVNAIAGEIEPALSRNENLRAG